MTQQEFDIPLDAMNQHQKERLYKEVKDGITFGRFAALADSFVYGVVNAAKERWKAEDEETILLRKIARLGNEYRKHRMHADAQELKQLCMDWNARYGRIEKAQKE
jgi:hypothetical protein